MSALVGVSVGSDPFVSEYAPWQTESDFINFNSKLVGISGVFWWECVWFKAQCTLHLESSSPLRKYCNPLREDVSFVVT